MCKTMEFQGKTVLNALEKASIELKIPENLIKYEVITYGSTGIFGLIGTKKAIIKVKNKKRYKKALRINTSSRNSIKKLIIETIGRENNFPEEALKVGQYVLQKIVDGITKGTRIESSRQGYQVVFEIKGGTSGVLIGKKGQTLEAIQYLIEKIINKNSNKRVRILIDVEGYLKKKKENLQRLANKMVDKVRHTKKPVTIGQMNSHDRRIVHTHLKDQHNIKTQSIGGGYYRKLIIFPQKNILKIKK